MDGETQTIMCLKDQIYNAKEVIENTKRNKNSMKGAVLRVKNGVMYVDDLKESIILLDLAHQSLIDQINMANMGAVRSQNIHQDKLNGEIIQLFGESDSALVFWRDNVIDKAFNIPVTKCVTYF